MESGEKEKKTAAHLAQRQKRDVPENRDVSESGDAS